MMFHVKHHSNLPDLLAPRADAGTSSGVDRVSFSVPRLIPDFSKWHAVRLGAAPVVPINVHVERRITLSHLGHSAGRFPRS